MMHRQMTSAEMTHLPMTEEITKIHLIHVEGFQSHSREFSKKVEFVYEKYHICIISTNVNQYLPF
jgi:hypothetical protein